MRWISLIVMACSHAIESPRMRSFVLVGQAESGSEDHVQILSTLYNCYRLENIYNHNDEESLSRLKLVLTHDFVADNGVGGGGSGGMKVYAPPNATDSKLGPCAVFQLDPGPNSGAALRLFDAARLGLENQILVRTFLLLRRDLVAQVSAMAASRVLRRLQSGVSLPTDNAANEEPVEVGKAELLLSLEEVCEGRGVMIFRDFDALLTTEDVNEGSRVVHLPDGVTLDYGADMFPASASVTNPAASFSAVPQRYMPPALTFSGAEAVQLFADIRARNCAVLGPLIAAPDGVEYISRKPTDKPESSIFKTPLAIPPSSPLVGDHSGTGPGAGAGNMPAEATPLPL